MNKTMRIVVSVLVALLFVACEGPKAPVAPVDLVGKNLVEVSGIWEPATDSVGSSFKATDPLVKDGKIDITFTIAKKNGDEWPYVELKCLPVMDFAKVNALRITYECDVELTAKLSQKDFGEQGDNTFAHYQYTMYPSEGEVLTEEIAFADFEQPSWASEVSREIPLKLENVSAVYLVPKLSYSEGETGRLVIHSLELISK